MSFYILLLLLAGAHLELKLLIKNYDTNGVSFTFSIPRNCISFKRNVGTLKIVRKLPFFV